MLQNLAGPKLNKARLLCLALSGGVDSMALFSLAKGFSEENGIPLFCFTVDHKWRESSTVEANNVSSFVQSCGIEHKILQINAPFDKDSTTTENDLRNSRYRALLYACLEVKARFLLLGHHLDDQVETLLLRLVKGSGPFGLGGMLPVSKVPNHQFLENGDSVSMLRPLLHIPKVYAFCRLTYKQTRLYDTCVSHGIRWFQDESNLDKSVTIRNAIRHLYDHAETSLPAALQKEAMMSLAQDLQRSKMNAISRAEKLFETCCRQFSEDIGCVYLSFKKLNRLESDYILKLMLRKVCDLVTPTCASRDSALNGAVRRIFYTTKHTAFTAGECLFVPMERHGFWRVHRRPYKACLEQPVVEVSGSEWILWDGRWWMKISSPSVVRIRPLHASDFKKIHEQLGQSTEQLHQAKIQARKVKYMVPLVESQDGERMLSLPTLGLKFVEDFEVQHFYVCSPGRKQQTSLHL